MELPRIKHKTYITWRMLEIKNTNARVCYVKSRKIEDVKRTYLFLYYLLLILRHPMKSRDMYCKTRSSILVGVIEDN
jgi:hypothetical protein